MNEYDSVFSPPILFQPIQVVGPSTNTKLKRKNYSANRCQNDFVQYKKGVAKDIVKEGLI